MPADLPRDPQKSWFVPTSSEEAIEAVLSRLEALHSAILSDMTGEEVVVRRQEGEHPWKEMARLMPTLGDFQMYAMRANKALRERDQRFEEREAMIADDQRKVQVKLDEARAIAAKLRPFEKALEAVLTALQAPGIQVPPRES